MNDSWTRELLSEVSSRTSALERADHRDALNEILDYSLPKARELCARAEVETQGRLHCHFLDLQPMFANHPEWFADDGIHENGTGSAAIAQEIVKTMKSACIAQPEASGCCTP